MDKSKPFGLIIPKRKKQNADLSKKSVFESDSEEEQNLGKKFCNTKIPQVKSVPKKDVSAAHVEDPSIYEYDNIYDDMKAKQTAESTIKDASKPSRYINTLLKAADKRKKEYERRVEKKVQVEREKEGDKYKDKEAFVTSAYKKKMLEMEIEEEKERRRNELNDMMDVTKQKDLSGFYRHFLNQTVGDEKIPDHRDISIKIEKEESCVRKADQNKTLNYDAHKILNITTKSEMAKNDNISEKNQYTEEKNEDAHSFSDSDSSKHLFNSCSSSGKESSYCKLEGIRRIKSSTSFGQNSCKRKQLSSDSSCKESLLKEHSPERHDMLDSSDESSQDENDILKRKVSAGKVEQKISIENGIKKAGNTAKVDIFLKRTVGELFANAQARYFERLASSG